MSRHPRDEQGAIAILTAFLMVGLMIGAALVVDLGNARDVRRQSQNASDAASLAGANMLYPATGSCKIPPVGVGGAQPCIYDAVAAVKSYALKNFEVSDWSTCAAPSGSALPYVLPSGGTSCISFGPNASAPTLVRVYMPTRTITTFFGGFTGRPTIAVGSSAQAQLGTETNCSLCILGNVNTNNTNFTVTGGSIAVNGSVSTGPNSDWTANSTGVHGTCCGSGDFIPLATPIPLFVDPLLNSLVLPLTTAALPAKTDPCSATATGGPGRYGAFSLPNSTCTLQPGLYVISGKWDMQNNTKLIGHGVTLYVKSPDGELDFKNGEVDIIAPSTAPLVFTAPLIGTGLSAGYAIVYDRNNTKPLNLQGNGGTLLTGVIYAPASELVFNGGSNFGFDTGPIVVGGVDSVGNSLVAVSNAASYTLSRKLLHLSAIP